MTDKEYQEIFAMLNMAKERGSHLMLLPLKCICGCSFFYPTLAELEEHNPMEGVEPEMNCPRCGRGHRVFIQHTGIEED